jgi:hypothetical protein
VLADVETWPVLCCSSADRHRFIDQGGCQEEFDALI